jgi:translocation and assembly module TamB
MNKLRKWSIVSGLCLVGLACLGTALWWWVGSASSLGSGLQLVARLLPRGQQLEVHGVSGSLWRGGRLEQLRWTDGVLQVQAQGITVIWDVPALLDGQLRLSQLQIEHLRINDQRPASKPSPPADLRLPLRVDTPLDVRVLEWVGPPAVQVHDLTGHYAFDGTHHLLDATQVRIASGSYQVHGSLQATGAMALKMELSGLLQTRLPQNGKAVEVLAQSTLEGAIGSIDAALDVQAHLIPQLANTRKDAMQADVQARIQPWQTPLVTDAKAKWRALDISMVWPEAPVTLLDGEADVTPSGTAWHANLKLANRTSGPWNLHQLPVERLHTQIALNENHWIIESLTANAAGGQIDLTGRYVDAGQWEGQASLRSINPSSLDARLGATRLDGQLSATQTPVGIAFATDLHSAAALRGKPSGEPSVGLLLEELRASGVWTAPQLKLDNFKLRLRDAQLDGDLQLNTQTWSGQGRVNGFFPGAQLQLAGDLSRTTGQGDVRVRVNDARLATDWMARWPGLATWARNQAPSGQGSATAHWDGGWQHLGLALATQGTLVSGERTWTLDAASHAQHLGDGQWDARLDALHISAVKKAGGQRWLLETDRPTDLTWRQDASLRTLQVAGGSARLSGPYAGAVQVAWQPAQWTQVGTSNSGASSQWSSQGELRELPLEWLTQLGQNDGAKLALQGNLVLGGQWDASGNGNVLHMRAALQRTRGDLEVSADDATPNLPAGVREAKLTMSIVNDEVDAQLIWNSANAGQLQARASTRLERGDGAWTWPAQAPVLGSLSAQLPRLRVWSLLAPPGWRLRGTLDANAQLSGTREAPQWKGTLQAQELSVRSVLDGVDFGKGALRLNLDGDGMEIAEFRLQGASSAGMDGGTLSIAGGVRWARTGEAPLPSSALQIRLQATAKELRVSTRADQRLVVSGKVSAVLEGKRLAIDGGLTADQGSFVLSEDSAPTLGNDVRVRDAQLAGRKPQTVHAPRASPLGEDVVTTLRVMLDLGERFQVQGHGINTRLSGQLELTATSDLTPRLKGEIRTASGTYKAYGQQLDIEDGVLRFFGPYDNPALDILAIRPNLVQRVGVQISGTALSPVVRLYSEPDMPDAEKLSWLVVGRANADGSAQMAMLQQAAMAMVSGNGETLTSGLANSLGLDEISMGGLGTNADSTGGTGATVKIGKRLAGNFYLAYERSIAGAYGTFYIFYDLSKHLTLRGQAGEQSAVDLIFTTRYD